MRKIIHYNILHLLLWSVVAVGFLGVFFGLDAIANWGDNSLKSILLAVLFIAGFGGDAVLRLKFKQKKNGFPDIERYESLRLKAMEFSYIITLLYIFLLAISIYTKYEASGLVPVGWLWFLAYSLILIVHISSSIVILVMYSKEYKGSK